MRYLKIVLVCLILLLQSCSIKHISDNNGEENYSIETISDSEIIESNKYILTSSLQNEKTNLATVSAKKFSGVFQVKKININTSKDLVVTSLVKSGNFRIVLIADKKIINDFEINSTSTFSLEPGKYVLKIVGESCEFSFKAELK